MTEIILEFSDSVVMQKKHTMSRIFYKNFGNWKASCKILIKYNSNNLDENNEEEKESINIEFTEENQILLMMKMLSTLNDQM